LNAFFFRCHGGGGIHHHDYIVGRFHKYFFGHDLVDNVSLLDDFTGLNCGADSENKNHQRHQRQLN